jgi:hypothetical protein
VERWWHRHPTLKLNLPGATHDPLFHNDTIGESALGHDSLPPNARLQHVLTAEVETAEAVAAAAASARAVRSSSLAPLDGYAALAASR